MKNQKIIISLLIILIILVSIYLTASFIKNNSKSTQFEKSSQKQNSALSKLILCDRIAKESIERLFWTDQEQLAKGTGEYLSFDPSSEPDYEWLLIQMHDEQVTKRGIYSAFGYDYGDAIIYILQHYKEWRNSLCKKYRPID